MDFGEPRRRRYRLQPLPNATQRTGPIWDLLRAEQLASNGTVQVPDPNGGLTG
jgi:hypothetical protein